MVKKPCKAAAGQRFFQSADVNSAIRTVVEKNNCARQACPMLTGLGSKKITVRPPSTPCAMTARSAIQPRFRIQRLSSARHSHTAMKIVSRPTVVATMRWPCS